MRVFTEPRSGVGPGKSVTEQRTERTTDAELLIMAARGLQGAADALYQIARRMKQDGK